MLVCHAACWNVDTDDCCWPFAYPAAGEPVTDTRAMGCAGAISAQRGDKRDAGVLQDAAAVRVAGGAAAAHLPHLPPPPGDPAHHPAHPHPRHLCLPPTGLLEFPPCFGRYWLDISCQTAEKVGSLGVETDKQRASACFLAWTVQHRPSQLGSQCCLTMAKQQWEPI